MRVFDILKMGIRFIIIFFLFAVGETLAGKGEDYSIIEKDQKKGLANKYGKVIIPPEYEDLGWTNGNTQLLEDVIGFRDGDLWGILNTKNEKITEPVYISLARFTGNWIVASRKLPYNSNIVFGVINAKGKAAVAFDYHNMRVHNDRIITTKRDGDRFLYGLIDEKAKTLIDEQFDLITPVSDQLFQVWKNGRVAVFNGRGTDLTGFNLDSTQQRGGEFLITWQNGKCGLIVRNGERIIEPTYKELKIEEGKVKARNFTLWSAFDHSNHLKTSYHYDVISPRGKGAYAVATGAAHALIDARDSLLSPYSSMEILDHSGDWISVKKAGKHGVLFMNGKIFLEPVYDSVKYQNGVFLVKNLHDGKRGWSMIDLSGQIITSQVYDELDWLGDAFFAARRNRYWGVVNIRGDEKIYCKYDSIVQYSEGRLLVKFLGEDGILNMDGSWEILPQKKDIEIVDPIRYLIRSPYGSYVAYYPDTRDFSAEYFLYKHGSRYLEKTLDQKYGLLNEEGKRVIRPEFDDISALQEDTIYYAKAGDTFSFITRSGKILVSKDPRFQEIREMEEEFIGVKIDGAWGFVDMNGKLRIANRYENIGCFNEGLAPVKIRGRWGYINKREDLIVQPAYDSVFQFEAGICKVVKKGKYGLINAAGQITLECEYDDIDQLKTGGFIIARGREKGLAGRDGRLKILPRFDHVTDLDNGFIIASKQGKYGLFSNEGVATIPMVYEDLQYDAYNNIYLAASPAEWVEIN